MRKRTLVYKTAALLLCLLVGLLPLTGCTSKGVSGTAGTAAPPAEEQQTDSTDAAEPPPPECDPLTGAAPGTYGEQGLRPVAVMIDGNTAALPQSGIDAASVTYEMVTEGGIPRMMAVFHSVAELGKVGPVRSTRDQFVRLALPQNAVLLHIGTSIYASNLLRVEEYPTVDGIYLGATAFAFDEARARTRDNCHCFYAMSELAAAGMAGAGVTAEGSTAPLFRFVPYTDAPRTLTGGTAVDVNFSFSAVAPVRLTYEEATGKYIKGEYGLPQMDEATGAQLSYRNLLLLGCAVSLKEDGLCTEFDFSSGAGWYLCGGCCEELTWEKGDANAPLRLFAADGSELQLNVGNTYVAFADTRALQNTLTFDGVSPMGSLPQEQSAEQPAG